MGLGGIGGKVNSAFDRARRVLSWSLLIRFWSPLWENPSGKYANPDPGYPTFSNVHVDRGKQAVDQKIYLKECINRRLLPFVDKYHSNGNILFWPDLARSHYSKIVQQ